VEFFHGAGVPSDPEPRKLLRDFSPIAYTPESQCFETPTQVGRAVALPSIPVARRTLWKAAVRPRASMLGELGILLGGFSQSKTVQLRVDLEQLHCTIIPSRGEVESLPLCRGRNTVPAKKRMADARDILGISASVTIASDSINLNRVRLVAVDARFRLQPRHPLLKTYDIIDKVLGIVGPSEPSH